MREFLNGDRWIIFGTVPRVHRDIVASLRRTNKKLVLRITINAELIAELSRPRGGALQESPTVLGPTVSQVLVAPPITSKCRNATTHLA